MNLVNCLNQRPMGVTAHRGEILVLGQNPSGRVEQPLGQLHASSQVPRLDTPVLLYALHTSLLGPRLQNQHTLHPTLLIEVYRLCQKLSLVTVQRGLDGIVVALPRPQR